MAQWGRALKRLGLTLAPRSCRDALLERFPALRRSAPRGIQLVFDRYLGEFKVRIDSAFGVERSMWTGVYEPELMPWLDRWIKPGWVCLDIGANVGAVSLALAQRARPGGRVFAFEPAPSTFARLRENLALNPAVAGMIEPVNLGLGEAEGVLRWSEEAGNEGNGTLLGRDGVEVRVTTVDAFVEAQRLAQVDFMKIDVESMEYEVLRGAARTLRASRPVLYFETMPRSKALRGADIFRRIEALLGEAGYRLYRPRGAALEAADSGRLGDYTAALPV
jgi:FkbM family methyltransferase